ncbi:sugar nucleotide-binding protein, partial [Vibrio rotiferianus]
TGVYGKWKRAPYDESDKVKPTTQHHISKHNAEKFIISNHSNYLILRVGWLFGGSIDRNKNFVANRIREIEGSNGIIYADKYQVGNPTYVRDLAIQLLLIIENRLEGVFNCVNEGVASRLEYIEEIVFNCNFNCKVLANGSFSRLAPVSNNESAINKRLEDMGLNIMPCWKSSLKSYMLTIGFNEKSS